MEKVKYIDGLFWIMLDKGEILEGIGGFIDPLTPQIIIEEMKTECD